MSATSLFTVAVIPLCVFEVLPIESHKLITNPYPINDWNSILVSSDPIKVIERKVSNETAKSQKPKARKRSFKDCPENDFNCLYGVEEDKDKSLDLLPDSLPLKVISGEEENKNNHESNEKNFNSGRQPHWNRLDGSGRRHQSQEDKDGWITLDPVPWSTSKISKWHPNVKVHESINSPWDYYSSTTQRPGQQQLWVSGSSYRPRKPSVPAALQWGIGTNDIITDNKPSGFPTDNFDHYGSQTSSNRHTFYDYKEPFQKYQQNHGPQTERYQTRFSEKPHPSTYPSQGNGEWILLSTKKGYSPPPPKRWGKTDSPKAEDRILGARNIKPVEITRYHEEFLADKKFHLPEEESEGEKSMAISNRPEKNDTTASERVMVPLQIMQPGTTKGEESTRTIRRKIRLQVLPSSSSSSLSHGGLLEVDSYPQTVNEAMEEEKFQNLQAMANVKKNKFRKFKLVPTNKGTGKGGGQRSAMTLAAVGAGMIPATMAILLPMAFGRSKRSLTDFDQQIHDNYHWQKL